MALFVAHKGKNTRKLFFLKLFKNDFSRVVKNNLYNIPLSAAPISAREHAHTQSDGALKQSILGSRFQNFQCGKPARLWSRSKV